MNQLIEQSLSVRKCLMAALYRARRNEKKDKIYIWRRVLEEEAGCETDFDLMYLIEGRLVEQDGPKYRLSALGVDYIEAELTA